MQYIIYWLIGVMHWLLGAFWVFVSITLYAHKLLSEPNIRSDGMLLLVYTDDCIILADSETCIDVLIHSLKNGKEKYILSKDGSIDIFLGISISKLNVN